MKNHKWEKKLFSLTYESVENTIGELQRLSEGLVDAQIVDEGWDGYTELYVTGWRLMTAEELETVKTERKKARDADKARKARFVAEELEALRKLADKYGVTLMCPCGNHNECIPGTPGCVKE